MNWKTLFLFPWVFYFYINFYQSKKYILLSVIFNLLILFEGGIHIFIWTNIFIGIYGILYFLESRKVLDLLNLLKFFLFQTFLGSIKIIPMVHFFKGYNPPENASDIRFGISPPYTIKEFFTALTTPFWDQSIQIILVFLSLSFSFSQFSLALNSGDPFFLHLYSFSF